MSYRSAISVIHAFITGLPNPVGIWVSFRGFFFLTSKLHYCNILLYGLPAIYINKLQRVQNAATRLVTNTPRMCHITPILEDLHWLPIIYRIEFKIVLLTFKCLYGLAPQYLGDVVPQSRYNLRSRNASLLVPAKARCLATVRNCGKVFRRRSDTFRHSHLLNKLSKHTFLKQLLIDLIIHIFL